MLNIKLKAFIFIIAFFCLVACNSETKINEDTTIKPSMSEEELSEIALAVLEANLVYSENEDIVNYMNTLTSDQNIPQIVASLKEVFEAFDLNYELLEIEVLSISTERAIIRTKQKTVATYVADGYNFDNHIAMVTHTLVNEENKFRFLSTEIDYNSVIFLDENGDPL